MEYIYSTPNAAPTMPPASPDTMLSLVDEYRALLDRKDELAEHTKANNKAIEACRNRLAELMVNEEVEKINRSGYTYTLSPKTKYTKAAGMDEELFALLREVGLGDIITETVNAQTLSSTVNQIVEENDGFLPEEWEGVVNEYSFMDISRRRDARKK